MAALLEVPRKRASGMFRSFYRPSRRDLCSSQSAVRKAYGFKLSDLARRPGSALEPRWSPFFLAQRGRVVLHTACPLSLALGTRRGSPARRPRVPQPRNRSSGSHTRRNRCSGQAAKMAPAKSVFNIRTYAHLHSHLPAFPPDLVFWALSPAHQFPLLHGCEPGDNFFGYG